MNLPVNRTRAALRRMRGSVPAMALLVLAGCASTPPVPETNLQAAQQAIGNAERVEAAKFAAAELDEARGKMSAAQRAVDDKQMVLAARLADESRADAELASARAGVAKANAVNQDMKRSNDTLIEEMQRKTGDSR